MEFHLGIDKPGLNKLDHALIPLQTSKLGQGITEIDICSVEIIGLILGEAIVVLFECLDNVHTVDLVNGKLHPMVHGRSRRTDSTHPNSKYLLGY